MSTYLLLRSNKQSGPYTLDQIRAIGVKAYDLIWVEGRSAAWRYPGEVEEFKSFAPAVEEQPYDRFYKRNSVKNQIQTVENKEPVVELETLSLASATNNSSISSSISDYSKTQIYTALPVVEKSNPVKEPLLQPAARARNVEVMVPPVEKKPIPFMGFDRVVEQVPLEEKFSQPLDDIKKQYIQQVLNRKKDSLQFRRLASIAAVVFGLILLFSAGVIIGLSINKRGINSTPKDLVKEEVGAGSQQADYHPHPIPVSANSTEQNPVKTITGDDDLSQYLEEADKRDSKENEKKKAKTAIERTPVLSNVLKNTPFLDSGSSTNPIEQRQATHRTDAIVAKDAVKNNISSYVSLSTNKYNVGTFGGISELQITVSNRCLYPLDMVVAEIQYVQANKKIFKTENIYFRNIGPGSALMQEAPKSPRGVKIQYRITVINSKELGLSYSGI